MSITLSSFIKKNNIENNKFVLILGTGFHIQGECFKKNILNDWPTLLTAIEPKVKLSGNYVLDFESIVRFRTANQKNKTKKTATQIEKEILKDVADKISNFTISISKENYPSEIFKSTYISDVINLNFDLVAEGLFTDVKKIKPQFTEYKQNIINKVKKPILSTLYFEANDIRFWHPHGSVKKSDTILLGLRSYFKNTQDIEVLRSQYKAKTKKEINLKKEDLNWFDLLTIRPVIICGASLSTAEWDIWLALVSRYRNYANYSKNENPIFMMHGYDTKNSIAINNVNNFNPISNKKLSYSEEWQLIEKLFKA